MKPTDAHWHSSGDKQDILIHVNAVGMSQMNGPPAMVRPVLAQLQSGGDADEAFGQWGRRPWADIGWVETVGALGIKATHNLAPTFVAKSRAERDAILDHMVEIGGLHRTQRRATLFEIAKEPVIVAGFTLLLAVTLFKSLGERYHGSGRGGAASRVLTSIADTLGAPGILGVLAVGVLGAAGVIAMRLKNPPSVTRLTAGHGTAPQD